MGSAPHSPSTSVVSVGLLRGLSILLVSVGGILVARSLGAQGFGSFSFVLAVVGVLGAVGGLRLELVVLVDAELARRSWAPQALAPYVAAASIASLLAALACLVALWMHGAVPLAAAWLAGVEVALTPLTIGRAVRSARGQQVRMAAYQAVSRAILLSGTLIVIWSLGTSNRPSDIIVALLAVRLAALAIEIVLQTPRIDVLIASAWQVSPSEIATILRMSRRISIAGVFGLANRRIDQVLLGYLVDPRQLGLYAAAVRVAELVSLIPASVQQVFAPRLSQKSAAGARHEAGRLFVKSMNLLMGLGAAATVVATLSADVVVTSLFGSDFANADVFLVALVAAETPALLASGLGTLALVSGKHQLLLASSGTALAVNLMLNAMLIPTLGAMGAATSSVVSYAGSAMPLLREPKAFSPIGWHGLGTSIAVAAVTTTITAVTYLILGAPGWQAALAGALAGTIVSLVVSRRTRRLLRTT